MNIAEWYKATVGNDSQNMVAENAGIVPSSLYRQLPDKLSAQSVVKIARAYGVSAIEGLVALGLLDDSDIRMLEISDSLKNASSDELLREIASRLDRDPSLADQPVWKGDPNDLDRRQVTDDEIADTINKLGKPDVGLAAYHGDHKLDDEGDDAA
ncbi:hypothetical protein H7U32_06105 [Bifidobacterium pullorum subsp. saeculare]|uniref:Uncharacterized protein n=1 Tax=Bifidobacterium pullorum subsp. saeculare TaxID=78257 RepID=A0A938WYF8_9BIFI|nr:hypothetical protein [Bifidobacterium pullorum]MBM6699885.1 hypothetical protein [Bifidobacterium pullorum subsp. saeculare]